MKTYIDLHPFTHYKPLDGHNVTLRFDKETHSGNDYFFKLRAT
jgi:hypothetical protein